MSEREEIADYMDDWAAQIAASLTDSQKSSLVAACMTHPDVGGEPFVTVDYAGPWPEGVAQFLSLRTDRLTPLGIAVRAHLTKDHPTTTDRRK